jgi:hypothetical protein
MDTTQQEQRINNAQRGALAEIVRKRFEERIEAARQAENQLEQQIAQELARKFGIASIDAQIERLEKEVKNLQQRKEELGFTKHYEGDRYRIAGGRAKALLEAKVKSRSVAVRDLRLVQSTTEQQIWLATTVEQAQQLVDEAEGKKAA